MQRTFVQSLCLSSNQAIAGGSEKPCCCFGASRRPFSFLQLLPSLHSNQALRLIRIVKGFVDQLSVRISAYASLAHVKRRFQFMSFATKWQKYIPVDV